jgi:hypothetical protein
MNRIGLVLLLLLLPALGFSQQSSCTTCHFSTEDSPGHLFVWDRSPHERNNVGCERCHGGDATSFDLLPAHQGILNRRNPASPINRRNLPNTCGSCHLGPYLAFQSSEHFALLQEGNLDAPVCTTCHSEVAARMLSPDRLEARCKSCHSEGEAGSHPEFPLQARSLLESVREIRALLDEAEPLIRRVKDRERRQRLEEQYQQAEVPLTQAVQSGHSFVFEAIVERREVARRRAEALLEELANPAAE